jgi:hypothetical protein
MDMPNPESVSQNDPELPDSKAIFMDSQRSEDPDEGLTEEEKSKIVRLSAPSSSGLKQPHILMDDRTGA